MATLDKAVNTVAKPAIESAIEVVDLAEFSKSVSLHQRSSKGKVTFKQGLDWGVCTLSVPIQFIGLLGLVYAQKYVNGDVFQIGKTVFSKNNRASVTCIKLGCAKIHGDNLRPENEGQWNVGNLALSPLFLINGYAKVISQTCVVRYLNPIATPDKIVGLAAMRVALARAIEQDRKHPYTGKRS